MKAGNIGITVWECDVINNGIIKSNGMKVDAEKGEKNENQVYYLGMRG